VTTSPDIFVAGAGIGGLTAALALAARGCRVAIFEQAPQLEVVGAGIQLSPNATRILRDLGVAERLQPSAVVPDGLVVRSGASGQQIVRMPLGDDAERRHGAPYWMVHRGDLQAALVAAVETNPNITMALGAKVEDFAIVGRGVTVKVRRGTGLEEKQGDALIGADGLWSTLRARVGNREQPRFRHRTAWRSLVAAAEVPEPFREPVVQLWLGGNAHLVHYPVRGGEAINIVAIARDAEERSGWSGEGTRDALIEHFSHWSQHVRSLLMRPADWRTWSLYDMPTLRHWGAGPVTLIGDAAHPMLPFLAQGAGMAIEDAAVLARQLSQAPDDIPAALRAYEAERQPRTAKMQQASRRNGAIYHKAGPEAFIRNIGMRMIGGRRLMGRYDWIYDWQDRDSEANTDATREAATS
jgi:2-polyprenyl-6-methoxyphenol hydroxylase-like FAD-dependent oxidoreductase